MEVTGDFSWHKKANVMVVEWSDNKSIEWYEIPKSLFDKLIKSEDPTRFYLDNIVNWYPVIASF